MSHIIQASASLQPPPFSRRPGLDFQLRLFSCRNRRRSGRLQNNAGGVYDDVGKLFRTRLDAIIITSMEPQAVKLQDEPIWDSLTEIADWSEDKTILVLWSSLTAHAAVLYLNRITGFSLSDKSLGIFDCDAVSIGHPLSAGLPSCWSNPHSRYHDVSEAMLIGRGYQILSKSREAGGDIFLKPGTARFIFFQEHPEHDAEALLLEYIRDVRRDLSGELNERPLIPRHHLDATIAALLASRLDRALQGRRDPNDLTVLLRLLVNAFPLNPWQAVAKAG